MPVVSVFIKQFFVLITINVCVKCFWLLQIMICSLWTVSMYRTGPTEVMWSIANQNRSKVSTSGSANWLVGATPTFTVWTAVDLIQTHTNSLQSHQHRRPHQRSVLFLLSSAFQQEQFVRVRKQFKTSINEWEREKCGASRRRRRGVGCLPSKPTRKEVQVVVGISALFAEMESSA